MRIRGNRPRQVRNLSWTAKPNLVAPVLLRNHPASSPDRVKWSTTPSSPRARPTPQPLSSTPYPVTGWTVEAPLFTGRGNPGTAPARWSDLVEDAGRLGDRPEDLAQVSPYLTERINRFEYPTHELGIQPEAYETKLDVAPVMSPIRSRAAVKCTVSWGLWRISRWASITPGSTW